MIPNSLVRWMGQRQWRIPSQVLGLAMPSACFSAIIAGQEGWGPHCTLSFDCDFPRDVAAVPAILLRAEHLQRSGSHLNSMMYIRWVQLEYGTGMMGIICGGV